MKKIVVAMQIIIAITIFSGCGGAYNKVSTPVSEIIKNKEKAYIVFSRPEFVGYALSSTVMEYNPDKPDDLKLVAVLGAKTKVIYPLDAGEHFFYLRGGENGDKIKITVEKGKIYYVQAKIKMGWSAGRFSFVPLSYDRVKKLDTMLNQTCDSTFLNANSFTEDRNKQESGASSFQTNEEFYKNGAGIEITCKKDKVIEMEARPSLKSLEKATLVEVNESAKNDFRKHFKGYQKQIAWDKGKWDISTNEIVADDGVPIEVLNSFLH